MTDLQKRARALREKIENTRSVYGGSPKYCDGLVEDDIFEALLEAEMRGKHSQHVIPADAKKERLYCENAFCSVGGFLNPIGYEKTCPECGEKV